MKAGSSISFSWNFNENKTFKITLYSKWIVTYETRHNHFQVYKPNIKPNTKPNRTEFFPNRTETKPKFFWFEFGTIFLKPNKPKPNRNR
ncbi:unnamed protein product [Cuscuta epithymum]|uniref:Uncharacterized protein n=1 Tax=Cuscuta epithymum TaxID=186058 RepID=A0AAV0GBX0_9ASTE|nr:unnamed protein product [Cuscuta epithymum]